MQTAIDPVEVKRLMDVLDQATGRLGESYQRIASLQAQLAEKDRALAHRSRLAVLGECATQLAHEIRNPLGGIQLYAELLKRDQADAGARDTCDRILAAAVDLNRLSRTC